MAKKNKKNNASLKLWLVLLMIPVTLMVYLVAYILWASLKDLPVFAKSLDEDMYIEVQEHLDIKIPADYVPVYMAAEEKYGVPWTLLAAHHRIETRFSTMSTLESPVGAVGHMQFMPCTFVGWGHPTCGDLGEGEISKDDLMNPSIIKKYGGYGIDANGDGIADPFQIEDAVYSAANYLSRAGVRNGELKKAIFAYNHSDEYVEDVLYFYKQYESIRDEIELLINEQ